MLSIIVCCTAVVTTLLSVISAAPVTKVLQNGLDGYNGCTDTYIKVVKGDSNDTANFQFWHDNFEGEPNLDIAWCAS